MGAQRWGEIGKLCCTCYYPSAFDQHFVPGEVIAALKQAIDQADVAPR